MRRGMSKPLSGPIAALDIGSNKICCFIAVDDGEGVLRVTGVGHQVSKGIRAGAVVDMDEAEATIRSVVHAAESMAGETIQGVILNLSGGYPACHTLGVQVAIDGHEISEADMRRVLAQTDVPEEPNGRAVLHALPVGYSIDGTRGIRDPRGMFGERLGVDILVVTATTGVLRNLTNTVSRCHLEVETVVLSPYASGLATLVDDELNLGATVVDMGGGTTTIAAFLDGEVIHVDSIPVGGSHVTSDIARGLSTPMIHAERMKTLYGSAMASPTDERQLIDVPPVGETEAVSPNHVPRSMLIGIIKPRIEETLELVKKRLADSGIAKVATQRTVLTGGASQLAGLRDVATQILESQVRIGRPSRLRGLADATGGPAFATCSGLLTYAVRERNEIALRGRTELKGPGGRIGRLGQWLRENF
ncbi:MAG: cell division protein FtsA [Rhodospirillaceae bacterium]|nr:cell division protein FtsA [Rhodospirillaceae bacterium]